MTNRNVYLKKLKLPEKYLSDVRIQLIINKPGTLSKKEKEWIKSYVDIQEMINVKPNKNEGKVHLSQAFINSLKRR